MNATKISQNKTPQSFRWYVKKIATKSISLENQDSTQNRLEKPLKPTQQKTLKIVRCIRRNRAQRQIDHDWAL